MIKLGRFLRTSFPPARRLVVVALIALVAFGLALTGMADQLHRYADAGLGQGLWDRVYYSLQLFALDAAPFG